LVGPIVLKSGTILFFGLGDFNLMFLGKYFLKTALISGWYFYLVCNRFIKLLAKYYNWRTRDLQHLQQRL